jgi:hypothetical protein
MSILEPSCGSHGSPALYSDELEPEEVSCALGVKPTHAHRRGESPGPKGPPYLSGAWLLKERGGDAEPALVSPPPGFIEEVSIGRGSCSTTPGRPIRKAVVQSR